MRERIAQFIKDKHISPAEFADQIRVQRSSVSHVLNGRNFPSAAFIQKMLDVYKDLNPRWLLLGEGSSIILSSQSTHSAQTALETSVVLPPSIAQLPLDSPLEHSSFLSAEEKSSPVTHSKTTPPNEEILSQLTPLSNPDSKRDINRIVIFYSDKTFESYTLSE